MSKKKKVIILSSMIALLAVTAIFNFVLSGNKSYSGSSEETAYFSEYRTQRSTSRNEQFLQLDKIIDESGEDTAQREEAISRKFKLTGITEQEMRIESLIKACGYSEVVVTISVDNPNVNVVVKDADFTQDDAIKIYDIVAGESNVDCENINIIAYL